MAKATRVAFQGEPGAYSEEALLGHFGDGVRAVPCRTFEEALTHVLAGWVEAGVVPVENSQTGPIREVQELLERHRERLRVVGEARWRVRHCLLGLPGSGLDGLEKVFSHPQALRQCAGFLSRLRATAEPFYDTAGAARFISVQGRPEWGAVAGRRAAELYGLEVLAADIASDPANTTCFWIVQRAARP